MTPKLFNYEILDQPEVVQFLFHPRPEPGFRPQAPDREDFSIPVADGIEVGASLHLSSAQAPTLLFFHGNGEIVSDYDDLGGFFVGQGLNFFVADYRGYGRSTGMPTVSSMMEDSLKVLDFLIQMKKQRNFMGKICVMGRSLGSAPALELARLRQEGISCLIIESGFARVSPLLETLGIRLPGRNPEPGSENVHKIKNFSKPCLIIHAEFDHIIPFSDGLALYEACPSPEKTLLEIKGANHNDIFIRGMTPYLEAVKRICRP
ncbi:alpha/beta hydrolase [Desulfospira joergensenii]|uniref:alpha/beta hydrolase n=1 Tax=Desulfospira joergensenii TaxID=53329 RepID=UPI0003B5E040|nr:alpha/beta fold hydrolase [Desulfospira joergensenii]